MNLKKIVKWIFRIPSMIYNEFVFQYRQPVYENKPLINGRIYLVSDKKSIFFGKDVRINSCFKSNPIGGDTRTVLFAKPNATIRIGNQVAISNSVIYASQEIVLEDGVMIGGDCAIYDSDFHSLSFKERSAQDHNILSKPVVIKRGAFIGAHSIILKGVTIGEESIVAAGSVVTKSIPPNEVWGGNPAKCIRRQNG